MVAELLPHRYRTTPSRRIVFSPATNQGRYETGGQVA